MLLSWVRRRHASALYTSSIARYLASSSCKNSRTFNRDQWQPWVQFSVAYSGAASAQGHSYYWLKTSRGQNVQFNIIQQAFGENANKDLEPAALFKADILILDATNLTFTATADFSRWRHLGAGLPVCFYEHLEFLLAATSRPALRYAVFDQSREDLSKRQLVDPNYLKQRRLQRAKQQGRKTVSEIIQETSFLTKFWWWFSSLFREYRPDLHKVVELSGFEAIQAQNGWEADDAIATICHMVTEKYGKDKSVLVVSNDTDLYQLVNENVRILQMPPDKHARAGLSCLRQVDEQQFQDFYKFSPRAFPLYLAMKGKKSSSIARTGISTESIARICQRVDSFEALQSSLKSREFRFLSRQERLALSEGPKSKLDLIKHNLGLTKLFVGRTSLPESFVLPEPGGGHSIPWWKFNARLRERRVQLLWKTGLVKSNVINVSPKLQEHVKDSSGGETADDDELKLPDTEPEISPEERASWDERKISLPGLIWLHPYNKGRSRYLIPHISALSTHLRRERIQHQPFAVSSSGIAIDIAITGNPRRSTGLTSLSIFMIVGEGDFLRPFHREPINQAPRPLRVYKWRPPSPLHRILEQSRMLELETLNHAAKDRLKALKDDGWNVHVVSFEVLMEVLLYNIPKGYFGRDLFPKLEELRWQLM